MPNELEATSRIARSESEAEKHLMQAALTEPHVLPCLQVIDVALDMIHGLAQAIDLEGEAERDKWALAARMYNSSASALRLITSGYPQQAFSLVRELLEHAFLADWFSTSPEKFAEWRTCSHNQRKGKFGAGAVRKALVARDCRELRWPSQMYDMLSRYATHPSPEIWQFFTSRDSLYIGPFFDLSKSQNCLVDLAKASAVAALAVSRFLPGSKVAVAQKERFAGIVDEWAKLYLPGWPGAQRLYGKPEDGGSSDT